MLLRAALVSARRKAIGNKEEMCHSLLRHSHSISNERIFPVAWRVPDSLNADYEMQHLASMDGRDESGINNAMTKIYKILKKKTCVANTP